VAGGLDDYESPEAHLVDEDFFLLLPCGREGLVLGFGRQRESVERADDMHVSVDGSIRHGELKGVRVGVLRNIRIGNDGIGCAHGTRIQKRR
jgi:hypothetical protein